MDTIKTATILVWLAALGLGLFMLYTFRVTPKLIEEPIPVVKEPSWESPPPIPLEQLDFKLHVGDGMRRFMGAIKAVESRGREGELGRAGEKGNYQFTRATWMQACRWGVKHENPELAKLMMNNFGVFAWIDVFAEQAMLWNWKEQCPDAYFSRYWPTLAGVHNQGPDEVKHPSEKGKKYWRRVKRTMGE